MTFEVRACSSRAQLEAALALRRSVFVGEQGISEAEEIDGRDEGATHLVALREDRVIGTCRLLEDSSGALRLGRMAVAASERRRGVASAMLSAAEAHGRRTRARAIILHAQTYACALYEGAGYRAVGEPFQEAGVEHVTMELELA